MNKRFVVEVMSYPRDDLSGKIWMTTWYGRGGRILRRVGPLAERLNHVVVPEAGMVREHGYARRPDAQKSWFWNHRENNEDWGNIVQIIDVEVA